MATDLKLIYRAATVEDDQENLAAFAKKGCEPIRQDAFAISQTSSL